VPISVEEKIKKMNAMSVKDVVFLYIIVTVSVPNSIVKVSVMVLPILINVVFVMVTVLDKVTVIASVESKIVMENVEEKLESINVVFAVVPEWIQTIVIVKETYLIV